MAARGKRPRARERSKVLDRLGHFCYWCGLRLIYVQDIPKKKRIAVEKAKIFWRGDNKIKWGWILTFDHVKPRSRGGKTRDNIVPCCFYCNMIRGKYQDRSFKKGNYSKKLKQYIIASWTGRVKEHWKSKIICGK